MKISKEINIDAIEYASQGNAILGIRDSGKSYTATFVAEQLMDNSIPIISFDPIGVWRHLKVGKKGKGYPVVVAGEGGDLPLTPESAPDIVRAAMRENVSLVLDLYSMSLSKADWKRIVEQCIRLLLYENKNCGLRHIFIEEASEFCPQRVGPDQGRVYAEIEKLARMGGNASLGYTLINQRAEEVNKAVLELCDCLFLHRQKGRHSLTALGKWLDIADTSNSKEIINSLPSLKQGECWIWSQGSHNPKLIKVPEKKTVHPDRRNPLVLAPSGGSTADVSLFVQKMKKSLSEASNKRVTDNIAVEAVNGTHIKNKISDKKQDIVFTTKPTNGMMANEIEITELKDQIEVLKKQVDTEKSLRQQAEQKLEAVKKMLAPQYEQMKNIFAEANISSSESNDDNSEIRKIWLPKFSGKPAELLEAILVHKRLDRAKWCKLTGTVYSSSAFDRAVTEFKKLKLVSKQGNEFILQS